MERVNGTPIYWLGASLGAFNSRLLPNMNVGYMATHLSWARTNVEYFINQVQALPLSKDAACGIISNMDRIFNAERLRNPQELVPKEEIDILTLSIYNFQAVLGTELPRANIFYITTKRAYDMTMLINQGESVLPEIFISYQGESKEEVIKDIREATKCLGFDISTGVGFHVYRAIEAIVVRDYFPIYNIQPKDWEKNKNLGNYINLLEKAGVNEKVTIILKHLKDHYRNPISHPEEFWDTIKAESAFSVAVGVITIMIQDIEETKIKSVSITSR